MIDAIVGVKGSGKTPVMLEKMHADIAADKNNVIFISTGDRLFLQVGRDVRIIDIREYPVQGYPELIAFLAGLNAKDYDISHIYIDSVCKIAQDDCPNKLSKFFRELSDLSAKTECDFTVSISSAKDDLPEDVQAFVSVEL